MSYCTRDQIGLQLNIEDADPDDYESVKATKLEFLNAIDTYLKRFKPVRTKGDGNLLYGKVLCECDSPLGGLMGAFQYGIAHGEGHCTNCGHPVRYDHYIKLDDQDSELTLKFFLLHQTDES